MPRVSRQLAGQHRGAIEDAAARLFRERGLNGVSVSDLMAAAGLTHGGFYGHFESKEALAAVACAKAFAQAEARWQARAAAGVGRAGARAAIVDADLSAGSRDAAGSACPAPALVVDVARSTTTAPVRRSYREGIERLLGVLSALQDGNDAGARRRAALVDLSTLIGALLLARATAGQALSDQVLDAARQALGGARQAVPD